MKRKFYNELVHWSKYDNKYPLVVSGARQVGKTYIIDKFCKENYKNYIYLNLMKDKDIKELFDKNISFDKKIETLELRVGLKLNNENTVVFFDEAQESEILIESLKFFQESENNYNIICAGSLLGVAVNRMNASYPVGKVIEKNLYPMDFEEFLMATNNERYIDVIKRAFTSNTPLEKSIHIFLMDQLKKYLFLGGMPNNIKNYIDNKEDLVLINNSILSDIVKQYINDMKKYNNNSTEHIRIKTIYEDIPSQLAKENQKFTFAKIDKKDNRKRDYISPLDWLTSSGLVLKCNLLNNVQIPLKSFIDKESYKLYLNDTGLLCNLSETPLNSVILPGDYKFNGVIAENYVASELKKMGYSLYYWSRKGKNKGLAEVDFVIQVNTSAIPVEVKFGDDTTSKSLNSYIKMMNPDYSIRISSKNFGFQNKIKSVPLYAAFCLRYLK